jgi:hypothetical protein
MLKSIIATLIGTTIGAACSLLGGIWKSNRDRRIAAKDVFRIFLEIKKLEIPNKDCISFKITTEKEILVEFARLTYCITGGERFRIIAAIEQFGRIKREDLTDEKIKDDDGNFNWKINDLSWAEEAVKTIEGDEKHRKYFHDDPRYLLREALIRIIESC